MSVETRVHGSWGLADSSRFASLRLTSLCSGVPLWQKMTWPSITSISLRTWSGRASYSSSVSVSELGSDVHDGRVVMGLILRVQNSRPQDLSGQAAGGMARWLLLRLRDA
jgi:hypothetical protein